jgi:hypothetical protein
MMTLSPRAARRFILLAAAVLLPLARNASCAQTPEVLQTANSVFIDIDSLQKHTQQEHPLPAWISSVEIGPDTVPATETLRMGIPLPRLRATGPRLRLTTPATATEPAMPPDAEIATAQFDIVDGENSAAPPADEPVKPPTTIARIRMVRDAELEGSLLVRLFFDDEAGRSPSVSAWNEIGDCIFQSQPLGGEIGMTTWESALAPLAGVSYIEIAVPGDGANLHGVFLTRLKAAAVMRGVDFGGGAAFAEPFDPAVTTTPDGDDSFLFGRVNAVLDDGTVKLPPTGAAAVSYDFTLENAPDVAVVTFEVLNCDVAQTPEISVNGSLAATATALLPDLADPAYRATVVAGGASPLYRYKGWLRCQKIVSGAALQAGENHLEITSRDRGAEVAVRSVQIQLKYNTNNN